MPGSALASAFRQPYWRLGAWYFFSFAFVGGFNPYFGLYLRSIGLSAWNIGLLLALMPIMRMASPTVSAWLGERQGLGLRFVRLSAAASLVAFGGFFASSALWMLFAAMALLAFFSTAALPLVEAMVLGHLREHVERYGRIRMWGSIGFVVAVLLIGRMLDARPIAALLWVLVGLLLAILAFALALPEAPRATRDPHAVDPGMTPRSPKVLALLWAAFFMSAAHAAYYVFSSIHLVEHGYDKTSIGALWALGVIAEIGIFMSMARLMRKFSLRAILLGSFALAVVRFLLFGWGVDWPLAVLAAQLMHGATYGAHHAASVAALNRWVAADQRARLLALYGGLAFGAGGLVGNLTSGWMWDALGAGTTYSLASVFALIGWVLIRRGIPACDPVRAAVRQRAVT